jgi:hypothetical protein
MKTFVESTPFAAYFKCDCGWLNECWQVSSCCPKCGIGVQYLRRVTGRWNITYNKPGIFRQFLYAITWAPFYDEVSREFEEGRKFGSAVPVS